MSCRRYEHGDTALISGSMIRECVKNAALAKCVACSPLPCALSEHSRLHRHVMESPAFYTLLAFTDVAVFEVASDAFLAFKARAAKRGRPVLQLTASRRSC